MLANALILAADQALTDEVVIGRVLAGAADQYEILVRRYNGQLYKTARGILSSEDDIEDVMQEAYIKGYEKLGQFRREARFSTWLTRILINCALQHLNKLKRSDHLDVDDLADRDEPGEAVEPESPSIGDNLRVAIEGAIGQLPPKYRVVFMLREVQQLSVADTAQSLGISEENVKVRLHRGKAMLKETLRNELTSLEVFEFHASRCAAMAVRVMSRLPI